ncbi:MAG: tetratricopeptide repeat protein, partial [Planctomycetota bacterium]|nr:tetratricopeptide repeat protein [Planctomycetota bacterium]
MRNVSTGKQAKTKRLAAIPGTAKAARNKTTVVSTRHADIHPLDRAIAELRSELARSPDDPTLLGRAAALFYRRGDLQEAERHYRRAIELAPHRATLHNNLGNVLCDMGRMRDGIAAYEHAIALEKAADPTRGPSPEAIVNLELARIENRLVHERIEYLERAAQLEVSSAEAQNTLGCGYLLRGQREQALEAFRRAAAMDPRNVTAGVNLAFAHTLSLNAPTDVKAALAEIAAAMLRFPD